MLVEYFLINLDYNCLIQGRLHHTQYHIIGMPQCMCLEMFKTMKLYLYIILVTSISYIG
jgi:hypothetical protein